MRTSPHFSRHLRSRSPSHAVFSTFPAHISTPKPTCAMANLDTRPEWHTPCALPGISHDICADNPPPTPYFQLFLRTSRQNMNFSDPSLRSGIMEIVLKSQILHSDSSPFRMTGMRLRSGWQGTPYRLLRLSNCKRACIALGFSLSLHPR